MIGYYRHTLINLFTRVQTIQARPMDAFEECYAIQQILIQKIIYIERKIQQLKIKIADLKK